MKLRVLLCSVVCSACSPSSGPGPVVPKTPVQRQMIGLLQKFDRWDDNGDGELDASELTAGLKGTPYKAKDVIDFYDTDGNRKISLREAQAGYSRSEEAERKAGN